MLEYMLSETCTVNHFAPPIRNFLEGILGAKNVGTPFWAVLLFQLSVPTVGKPSMTRIHRLGGAPIPAVHGRLAKKQRQILLQRGLIAFSKQEILASQGEALLTPT